MTRDYTELPERLSEKLRNRYYELMDDCRTVFPKVPSWWAEACVGSYIRKEEAHLITPEDEQILKEEETEWQSKLVDERMKKASEPNIEEQNEAD